VAWTKAHLRAKCHLDPPSRLAAIDMTKNWGGGSALYGERELGPHLTQCRLSRGLPLYQVAL